MDAINARFRKQRREAAERLARERQRRLRALGMLVALLALAGAGFALLRHPGWLFSRAPEVAAAKPKPAAPRKIAPFVPALLDLPGDPLSISLGSSTGGAVETRSVAKPEGLADPAVPATLQVFSDRMLASSERFMITLPSSAEDFAFFQAQSGRLGTARASSGEADEDAVAAAEDAAADAPETAADADEVLVPVESQDDNVGETVAAEPAAMADGEAEELGDGAAADSALGEGEEAGDGLFAPTAVENTTTLVGMVSDADRFRPDEDVLVRLPGQASLAAVITDNGFAAADAEKAAAAVALALGGKEKLDLARLPAGHVIAMRGHRDNKGQAQPRLVQLSLYRAETFLATVALGDDGAYAPGADPWVEDELLFYSTADEAAAPRREYRLLDALYSAATRGGVPTAVTGEAIMLMSRTFDLQGFASPGDRLLLIYSGEPRDRSRNAGRLLYAAIRSPERSLECFVFAPQPGADFACLTEKDQTSTVTVTGGMLTPVSGGTMTSRFGPRMHPILHRVIVHKGVDWAAPVGTPIMAAFDGTVSFVGEKNGFGNFVRIEHGGGRATGYAHMSRFADGEAVGRKVSAGDVIGYVGTTGRSTGPHLHFELYQDNVAVDPLGLGTSAAPVAVAAAVAVAAEPASDDSAVEKLVNRIVHVESGGNARAKNPLSSASGLGQFIESTWIRMMQTYRPELARSMSRAALLELRFDPTVSREMVANLAREGESYLRARGHSITAGRLYLAHFLGMEGANTVLSANGASLVVDVMGPGVIKANPFLTGKDCAYVIAWAERKMSGKAPAPRPPPSAPGSPPAAPATETKTIVRASPEFLKFKEVLSTLVAAL